MILTLAIILIVFWALGLITSTTMGGLVHILIVLALILIVLSLVTGRKAV